MRTLGMGLDRASMGGFRLLRWKVVMSLHKLALRIIAGVTMMVTGSAIKADTFHPFADPMEFDPDWQFFAPVDVDSLLELPARKRANVGWFATYDRTYLWTSRPNVEDSANSGDFGWGNRFDLGLMRDDRSGWLFSFRNMGGPNVYDRVYQERIDRFNANDVNDPINNPVQPFIDANDPQLATRAYILGDSLNVAGLTNFEVNKTWRRTPYRYGGTLEPMIGFKYSTFKDFALNQSYDRNITQITTPGATTASTQLERLISSETTTQNRMVGGQLGARYFTHINRWTLSGEFRAFAMSNFQTREFRQLTIQTEYAGAPALGVATAATQQDAFFDYTTNTEFVFGFEARAEAAYQVTRSFNLRAGIDVLNFAQGIWRGANPPQSTVANVAPVAGNISFQHDQDVQMAGFTFGATLNR